MEELIMNAIMLGENSNRIAIVGSSIYLDPSDDFLSTFDSVNIIKGAPIEKQEPKINSKKIKDSESNGTE